MKDALALIKELTEESENLHASYTKLERKCASLNDECADLRAIAEQYQRQFEDCAEDRAKLTEENERLKERAERHLENLKAVLGERSESNIVADTVWEYGEKVYQLIWGFVGEKLSEQDKDYITVRLGQIAKEILGVEE